MLEERNDYETNNLEKTGEETISSENEQQQDGREGEKQQRELEVISFEKDNHDETEETDTDDVNDDYEDDDYNFFIKMVKMLIQKFALVFIIFGGVCFFLGVKVGPGEEETYKKGVAEGIKMASDDLYQEGVTEGMLASQLMNEILHDKDIPEEIVDHLMKEYLDIFDMETKTIDKKSLKNFIEEAHEILSLKTL